MFYPIYNYLEFHQSRNGKVLQDDAKARDVLSLQFIPQQP